MYLKSKNNKYINISQKSITATIDNGIKYGRLYNGYSVTDPRGLAPTGWHIPTQSELNTLVDTLGGFPVAGLELQAVGPDKFSLPLGGYWGGADYFAVLGLGGTLCSSTAYDSDRIQVISIQKDEPIVSSFAAFGGFPKERGITVRLIKDDSINDGNVVIDGDTYNTVTIGTQVWLQQNLAVKHYQNGDLIESVFSTTEGAVSAYDNDEANVYDIVTATQVYPVINGDILYDTILDNPIDADRFNGINTLDILDLEFPCEESLIQPIIDLCLKEISAINGISRDATNNASDDASLPKQQ